MTVVFGRYTPNIVPDDNSRTADQKVGGNKNYILTPIANARTYIYIIVNRVSE